MENELDAPTGEMDRAPDCSAAVQRRLAHE